MLTASSLVPPSSNLKPPGIRPDISRKHSMPSGLLKLLQVALGKSSRGRISHSGGNSMLPEKDKTTVSLHVLLKGGYKFSLAQLSQLLRLLELGAAIGQNL